MEEGDRKLICGCHFVLGEVFVLDDGGEVDLDLGNYERFLDIRLTKDNNLTTGKIYQYVINKERKGDYLGKTVQGNILNMDSFSFDCCLWLETLCNFKHKVY